jgi:3-deoxy-D-manno-octulosonic-acid transferase
VFSELKTRLDRLQQEAPAKSPLIWMHCASLGEFEQGRPLLEAIRARFPGYHILLTFFSPSGYEIRKNYPGADIVCYLPADGPAAARELLELTNPALVLWIKYEYWYFYLTEIKKRKIPLLLISGIFRPGQPFFKWYGGLHRKMLSAFTHFFVQTTDSKKCLGTLGISGNVTISGDTRFDRVIDIAEKFEPLPLIASFCEGYPVIVAGSTWPEDEEELDHYANIHPALRFIIVPHETGEDHIRDIEKLFTACMRYSALAAGEKKPARVNVLIIDNIGMLSRIYRYATITYVGGGFGDSGLHNVLEAAVYSKPVIFGPVYDKFAEAVGLLEAGGGFSVENTLRLEELLDRLITDEAFYRESCRAAGDFVYARRGATLTILNYIQENRLLTSL